jgi:fructan beta-fructosidase
MVFAAYDKVRFYTSPNLIDWTFTGTFGIEGDTRLWECPDLFPMQVEDSEEVKWVLITSIQKQAPNGGTATGYFVGDWDGKTFIGDASDLKWLDYGTDNYAMVTWSDIPESDGRRLGLGWMSNWQYAQVVPTEKWRSAMTLPRELKLVLDGNEYEVYSQAVSEFDELVTSQNDIQIGQYNDAVVHENKSETLLKLDLRFKIPQDEKVEIRFSNDKNDHVSVGYKIDTEEFFIDRRFGGETDFSEVFAALHTSDHIEAGANVEFSIFLDHSSIEVFAEGGKRVMTDIFFPESPLHKIELVGKGELIEGKISTLKGLW